MKVVMPKHTDNFGMRHDPYGMEHPYEYGPVERIPRDPEAGQPVILGAITWPPGAAEAVWVSWIREGSQQSWEAEGRWLKDNQECSYWQIELPLFARGEMITYRVHARKGKLKLDSKAFSFFVSGWCRVGEVVAHRWLPQGLQLEMACEEQAMRCRAILTISDTSSVRIKLVGCKASAGDTLEHSTAIESSAQEDRPYQILQDTPEQLIVGIESLQILIWRRPFRLELLRRDGTPLLVEMEPLAWLIDGQQDIRAIRQTFACPSNEVFYGLGERFNALDQRGQELDSRVFDQYKRQGKRTYLPVPFLLSSQGYGIYWSTARWMGYDLAATQPDRWSYKAELGSEGILESHLMFSDDPKTIITSYSKLTGRPNLPPMWAFGPWMSGNEWNNQDRVLEQAHMTVDNRIPATVIVLEAWSDEATFYIWNGARYDPKPADQPFTYSDFTFTSSGLWPDPKGMIDELHHLDLRVLLWQIPVMKRLEEPHPQHEEDEAYMLQQKFCVHQEDGQPYRVRPFWFHKGLVLDVTNTEAVRWWLSKRAYLLDELKVDGFKTDGGEHLWGRSLRFADGRRGDELINLYPNLYVKAYHRLAQEKRGGKAITFSRAGFAGAQAWPGHWAGDEDSTWEAFRASILAGLNAGLSGIPFWGWDLAGFGGEIPTAELYLRATAMATFCPIMQYHSEYQEYRQPCQDRTPWNIQERTGNPEVIPIFRLFANLRMNLLPYIYGEAWRSSQDGIPMMRALVLEYPQDETCRQLPYQYHFGQTLLVAPVVEEGCRSQAVYLPAGRWHDFWTGKSYWGPQIISYPAALDRIPVFVRAGSFLPLNLGNDYAMGSFVGNTVERYQNLVLKLYPEGEIHYPWYDGISAGIYDLDSCQQKDQGITTLNLPAIGQRLVVIVEASMPRTVQVNGRQWERAPDDLPAHQLSPQRWKIDRDRGSTWLHFPASKTPWKVILCL